MPQADLVWDMLLFFACCERVVTPVAPHLLEPPGQATMLPQCPCQGRMLIQASCLHEAGPEPFRYLLLLLLLGLIPALC